MMAIGGSFVALGKMVACLPKDTCPHGIVVVFGTVLLPRTRQQQQ